MNTICSKPWRSFVTVHAVILVLSLVIPANILALTNDISQSPLILTKSVKPQVLLNMSNDHQLFFTAYNDYDDIDGDGKADGTYIHSVDYYGYFDPDKCYDYDTTDNRFEPVEAVDGSKYCPNSGAEWSGNFLNWAAMARIDVVRKILYGGKRSTDTSSETVLERTYLANDAHAWVKYYGGSDINKLTPFTPPTTAETATSATSRSIGTGSRSFTFSGTFDVEQYDQVTVVDAGNSANTMIGHVTSISASDVTIDVHTTTGSGTIANWELTSQSRIGITICNATKATSSFSHQSTDPPLIRVASGNYGLWTANERYQCRWNEETSKNNGNKLGITGMHASQRSPVKADVGLGQDDYNIRVEVCVSDALKEDNCTPYTDTTVSPSVTTLKPTGLLQQYGDDESLLFGLMTGSYDKNKSGGVLRKNIGAFTDEVNVNTDGTFKSPPSGGNIVDTLDRLNLFGYKISDGTYRDGTSDGDNCNWGTASFTEGNCSNWGNPQSELLFEGIRYFAGKSATSAMVPGGSGKDNTLGLPTATWVDPLVEDTTTPSNNNYCAPISIIQFNTSTSSFDNDQVDTSTWDASLPTAKALTDVVGASEGIHNNDWFVGENGSDNNQLCTGKTVDSLGNVRGTCPELPRLSGTYYSAGLAYEAYKNRIRTDLTEPVDTSGTPDPDAQRIKLYGVELSPAIPKVDIPVGSQTVTIQPACRNTSTSPAANCAIVNFTIVTPPFVNGSGETVGQMFVQWEDTEHGGDYDQDMAGTISFVVNSAGTQITVTSDVISKSTPFHMGFGYILSGTNQDGFHVHSGINSFDYTDTVAPISGASGCSSCVDTDSATSAVYSIGTSSAAQNLRSPLYYASKYGGYNREMESVFPATQASWDSDADGLPDNYFYARNPQQLEDSLSDVFAALYTEKTSTTTIAVNSYTFQPGTVPLIFQALFESETWSGRLIAYQIDPVYGTVSSTTEWDAQAQLDSRTYTDRDIFIYDPTSSVANGLDAIPLTTWSDLSAGLQTQIGSLNKMNYLRGDQTNELTDTNTTGTLRERDHLLGDIINSDPQYVGNQSTRGIDFGYNVLPGTEGTSYATYKTDSGSATASRPPMIYVGANDGMLHAFYAGMSSDTPPGGKEAFAYIPRGVLDNLDELPRIDYDHRYYVDGPPRYGDAYFARTYNSTLGVVSTSGSPSWHTVLVGGLGGGGTGVYALDITDPENFSAEDVMWDIVATSGGDFDDLGHVTGQPYVVRMANGEFAAVFSNGFDNATGKAVLYIVDIADGSLIKKLDTGVGSVGDPNGLAPCLPVDVNFDRIVDYIYAGDIKGNMWKFDVTNTNEANWDFAFYDGTDPAPLFKAIGFDNDTDTTFDQTQAITTRPDVGNGPSGLGGYMVYFGTGRLIFVDDNDIPTDQVQTTYGIWDNGNRITATDRSDLVKQEILIEKLEIYNNPLTSTDYPVYSRQISNNTVDYSAKRGWYLDLRSPDDSKLPADGDSDEDVFGERIISPMILFSDRLIYTSIIPSEDPCLFGGDGWIFEVGPMTGGQTTFDVFDLNKDSGFDSGDRMNGSIIVNSIKKGFGVNPGISGAGEKEYKYLPDKSGNIETITESRGGIQTGRASWRQLK